MKEIFVPLPERGHADGTKVPAGRLCVTRVGQGTPMVLLHGFPLSARMWKNQWESLADQYEFIAPDLRGFGKSSKLVAGWQVDDFARDISAMLDALEIPSAIICGLSLGGYIAFEFLAQFKDKVSGLVLCNTRANADEDSTARGRRLMAERVAREGTWFVHGGMVPKLLAQENRSRKFDPDVPSFFEVLTPDSIATTQLAMAERRDFTESLSTMDVPVHVIAGEGDIITRANEMQQMASEIPSSQFTLITGAGHLTPIENPSEFNQALSKGF